MPTLPRLERVSDTEGEHSDDSAGEKEAKRQRSEPTTPVSTSGRLPYEYDAVMGITKVGTKEAEGFDEDFDAAEYHDAAEEPIRKDESDNAVEPQRLSEFQGGYGSSSLKECIELLNTTSRIAPAPLDSGIGQNSTEPPHCAIRAKAVNHMSQHEERHAWGHASQISLVAGQHGRSLGDLLLTGHITRKICPWLMTQEESLHVQ